MLIVFFIPGSFRQRRDLQKEKPAAGPEELSIASILSTADIHTGGLLDLHRKISEEMLQQAVRKAMEGKSSDSSDMQDKKVPLKRKESESKGKQAHPSIGEKVTVLLSPGTSQPQKPDPPKVLISQSIVKDLTPVEQSEPSTSETSFVKRLHPQSPLLKKLHPPSPLDKRCRLEPSTSGPRRENSITESSSGSEQDALHLAQKLAAKRNLKKTKSKGKGKSPSGQLSPTLVFDEIGLDNRGYHTDTEHSKHKEKMTVSNSSAVIPEQE